MNCKTRNEPAPAADCKTTSSDSCALRPTQKTGKHTNKASKATAPPRQVPIRCRNSTDRAAPHLLHSSSFSPALRTSGCKKERQNRRKEEQGRTTKRENLCLTKAWTQKRSKRPRGTEEAPRAGPHTTFGVTEDCTKQQLMKPTLNNPGAASVSQFAPGHEPRSMSSATLPQIHLH